MAVLNQRDLFKLRAMINLRSGDTKGEEIKLLLLGETAHSSTFVQLKWQHVRQEATVRSVRSMRWDMTRCCCG